MSDSRDHPQPGPEPEDGKPAPAPTSPTPEAAEDAGTQALSDALQRCFAIIKVIMIGLVVVFLFSGFFTVGTQEKAVILRFGIPVGGGDGKLLSPGSACSSRR